MLVHAVGRPEISPIPMPARFRTDISYFITPKGEPGVPELQSNEHWISLDDAKTWLDELVVYVVSPLDASVKAEVELSEDQETWLEWMVKHEIQHVRLEEKS